MMRDVRDLIEEIRQRQTEPRILKIDEEFTDLPGVLRYTVHLDDGRSASTIKRELVQEAYRLQGLEIPVYMERQRRHVGSYILTKIAPLGVS